jgi:hypothetical protein
MRTRYTRPTLADLWRVLLADLEALGADHAPETARFLAVTALTGRTAEAFGVRIEGSGGHVVITVPEAPMSPVREGGARHVRPLRRVPAVVGR